MAIKSEISWRRHDAEGNRVEVYARRSGGVWKFHARAKRNDLWQPVPQPPLEDWLSLIDALERRMARRLVTPDEVARVRRALKERFPDAPTAA